MLGISSDQSRGLRRGMLRGLTALIAAAGLAGSGLAAATAAGASTTAAGRSGCTRTVTGRHRGGLEAAFGLLCLEHATQDGPVWVWPGARLRVDDSTITGALTATRARSVTVCGSTLLGPVRARRTAGAVTLGGAACGW